MRAAAAQLVARLADEPLGLALLARTRVLVASAAGDHEHARHLGARMEMRGPGQRVARREPVERQVVARVGEARTCLARPRCLVVRAIGGPRDLFQPLDLARQRFEQRGDEASAKPLAKLVARELDARGALADFAG